MADLRNAEEAILLATNQVETWRAEFLEEWFGPVKRMMVNMMMRSMTPEQKKILRDMSGKAYDQVMKGFDIQEMK